MSIPPEHSAEDSSASASSHPYSAAPPILPTDRRPSKWLILFKPKVGIPLAILIVLASIPLAIRSWRISSLPQIDEPFDVEAFCSVTIPDEENAFVEYREAFALFAGDTASVEEWGSQDDLNRGLWKHAPTAFRTWISANDRAIEKWLEGTRKTTAMSVTRRRLSYATSGHSGEEKAIARLVVMKAGRHLSRNENAEAWKLLHATLHFSRHVGQNGGISRRACGIGIYAMAARGIVSWAGHPKTSAPDIKHAMAVLPLEYSTMTQPYSTTLKHEHLVLRDFLMSFDYRRGVFFTNNNYFLDSTTIFLKGEPEFSAALLDHVLTNQLEGVDSDSASRPAFVPGNECLFDLAVSPSRPVSGTRLSELMDPLTMIDLWAGIPRLKLLLTGRDLERCMQQTMLAVLAVEHFVRLHDQFPMSLAECVAPESTVSFSDSYLPSYSPLIYKTDGNYAVIYSVGPDGIDDWHLPQPTDNDQQSSWSVLENSGTQFEGYRIPLGRPASTDDKAASVGLDNVQD